MSDRRTIIFRQAQLDPSTGCIRNIDFAHHKIHDGRSYIASDTYDLGNNEIRKYQIKTPDTKTFVHIVIGLDSVYEESHRLIENPDSVSGGAVIPSYNRNRNNQNTSEVILMGGVASSGGTMLIQGHIGTEKKTGGEYKETRELMLKQGEDYVFEIKNETNIQNAVALEFEFYEHEHL